MFGNLLKFIRYSKKQGNVTYNQQKNQSIETDPEIIEMTEQVIMYLSGFKKNMYIMRRHTKGIKQTNKQNKTTTKKQIKLLEIKNTIS